MTAINFMQQTADIYAKSGTDMFANQSFSSAVTVKCKFRDRRDFFKSATGEEITADASMVVMSTVTIDNEYKVVYETRSYEVIGVAKAVKTVTTLGHIKVYLKSLVV